MPISWKDPIPVWASLMGDSSTLKDTTQKIFSDRVSTNRRFYDV